MPAAAKNLAIYRTVNQLGQLVFEGGAKAHASHFNRCVGTMYERSYAYNAVTGLWMRKLEPRTLALYIVVGHRLCTKGRSMAHTDVAQNNVQRIYLMALPDNRVVWMDDSVSATVFRDQAEATRAAQLAEPTLDLRVMPLSIID